MRALRWRLVLCAGAVAAPLFASPARGQETDVTPFCVDNPQTRPRVSRLWGEVRQALQAWARTVDSARYRYELTLYDRRLTADGRTILGEELQATDRTELYELEPAAASLSPRAPATLLALENSHCFSLDEQPVEHPGQVALRFEPSPESVTTDSSTIAGVFRLDRETAQLKATEYMQVVDDRIRGILEFERLGHEAWITRRWWVRVPIVDSAANPDGQPAVAGYREFGGVVTAAVDDDGVEVFVDRSVALLTGAVFDTTQSAPPGRGGGGSGGNGSMDRDRRSRRVLLGEPAGGRVPAGVRPPAARLLGVHLGPGTSETGAG